jgi:hypothetical protein
MATVGVLAAASGVSGSEALKMHVTPSISRAPALLTVRVSVRAAADDHALRVVAESADFYRSSEIPIDGLHNPPLTVFEFPNVPAGQYTLTSVLVGPRGPRASVIQLARVEPPFGR